MNKALKTNKRPEDPIYFADAAHPQHNSVPAYGLIKKGQEPEIIHIEFIKSTQKDHWSTGFP